ncbi:hypothetical protein [Alteribacillus sp. HJP-4]|uniref:hypothetical protein n=1 Tax=Alteribacillus sp. HJP-4 TaxID=2775394 RepID=UPI0035CCEF74
MDKSRKELIVKEIKYWKDNQLLPSEYCDFLLVLYTEGEEGNDESASNKKRNKSLPFPVKKLAAVLFLIITCLLTFIVIYFTPFSISVQIITSIIFALSLCMMARFLKKEDRILMQLFLAAALVILLLISTYAAVQLFNNNFALWLTVTFNCMLWTGIGRKLHMNYLSRTGIVCVIAAVAIYFLFYR